MSLPASSCDAPPRRAIDDAIRAIPIEWFKASPAIYWTDLLSSAALGWGALAPGQETYSYYGPLNKVSFNVGYHNEHHDIVTVPWSKLPEVRRIAPEFYDSLQSYSSWSSLLVRFIRDSNITLYNAIVRPGRGDA